MHAWIRNNVGCVRLALDVKRRRRYRELRQHHHHAHSRLQVCERPELHAWNHSSSEGTNCFLFLYKVPSASKGNCIGVSGKGHRAFWHAALDIQHDAVEHDAVVSSFSITVARTYFRPVASSITTAATLPTFCWCRTICPDA